MVLFNWSAGALIDDGGLRPDSMGLGGKLPGLES